MRVLEFDVDQQRLRKNPNCDFNGIVAGSVGYLRAKFNFSSEWKGCAIAARFTADNGTGEFEVGRMLDKNNECDVPPEVLVSDKFYVSVKGVKNGGNYQIISSEIKVKQGVN